MWLPDWRRKTKPARSRAARTSRPDRSVGSLATWQASRSRFSSGLDLDELLACFGGDRIASVPAVLDVKLDGFADVVQRFGAGVALADASGQSWNANDIAAIVFLL